MVELGLYAGLRVSEMASLKHSNMVFEIDRAFIPVIGKDVYERMIEVKFNIQTTFI